MLSRSSTREPLASFNHDALSPSSSDDKCSTQLRPLPLPVMSRTSSRASSASYSSTMALNPNNEPREARRSIAQKLFSGWKRGAEKDADREAQRSPGQSPHGKGGGTHTGPPTLRWWQGWKAILCDSCGCTTAMAVHVVLNPSTSRAEHHDSPHPGRGKWR